VLLILGHVWQRGGGRRAQVAKRCIGAVQVVSKWASPDMFAYILMLCLFRKLSKPPQLLSDMHLGLGFTCFGIFCVGSTVSSLGLRAAERPAEGRKLTSPTDVPRLHGWALAVVLGVLASSFAVLLIIGLASPCMELRLDMQLLYSKKPKLAAFADIVEQLGLQDLMHAEVSVWSTLVDLGGFALEGETNSLIAFLMYGLFVVLAPLLDMLTLLFAAYSMCAGTEGGRYARGAMAASRVLRKVSMLDVSLMGTVVIVLSLANMKQNGVILSLNLGALALLGAEVCHYLTSWVVRQMREAAEMCEGGDGRGPSEGKDSVADVGGGCSSLDSSRTEAGQSTGDEEP